MVNYISRSYEGQGDMKLKIIWMSRSFEGKGQGIIYHNDDDNNGYAA